jgi:hypothetical protein
LIQAEYFTATEKRRLEIPDILGELVDDAVAEFVGDG